MGLQQKEEPQFELIEKVVDVRREKQFILVMEVGKGYSLSDWRKKKRPLLQAEIRDRTRKSKASIQYLVEDEDKRSGVSAADIVEKYQIDVEQSLDQVIDVGEKLNYLAWKMRQHNIVHRDLKPDNVLFGYCDSQHDEEMHDARNFLLAHNSDVVARRLPNRKNL